ncbi:hypothetical protein GCM10009037_06940 [Halarchaeum grantii]|uniref:Uncharacterized protein n=1 Tax=Halarchaeum grantii TaxID=1193105 RepID=A0A830ESS6_9EURY|nr:hypothetical protein [Halarchaeum grantii]GGL25936.1 hypothetical protein GCM10009037_06940 [Halarchaeum grantii]
MKPRADRIELSREGNVPACPHCGRAGLSKRENERGEHWYCRECGERASEAEWRPPKSTSAPSSGSLASRLLAADPDDVGGQA